MRRLLPLAVLVAAGCAPRLQPGLRRNAVVVEARAVCEAAADCRAQARKEAVAKAAALYVAKPESAKTVLERPGDFIKRWRVVDERASDGGRSVTLRAEVQAEPLAAALDKDGLLKPEGIVGRPRLFISLKETGPGAGFEVGRASDALRRALSARGYQALDFSDRLGRRSQKTGTPEEAREEARALGAEGVLTGSARAEPAQDERLEGFSSWRGFVKGELEVGGGKLPVEAEAAAVDLSPEAAAAKALDNAGMLAGERLADDLRDRFIERSELGLYVTGLARPEQAARFIAAVRALPGVIAASPARVDSEELRLRVFAERLGAEDLAAELIRLRGFSLEVRGVDPAAKVVDVEVREG